ncbi:GGDEF domain-containing protein [Vibrio sp. PP-XX7]
MLFDVDNFKVLNDTQGRLFGDVVLAKVAMCIKNVLRRPSDKAIRYGGEEFLVILPETDANGAIHIAEQVLENVRALRIENNTTQIGTLTISAGNKQRHLNYWISICCHCSIKPMCDSYRAKNAGKNQVVSDTTHTLQHPKQRFSDDLNSHGLSLNIKP